MVRNRRSRWTWTLANIRLWVVSPQSSFHGINNKNFLDASLGGMLELYPTWNRDYCFSKNVSRSVFLFRGKNLGLNFSHFQTAHFLLFEYLFKKFWTHKECRLADHGGIVRNTRLDCASKIWNFNCSISIMHYWLTLNKQSSGQEKNKVEGLNPSSV